MKENDDKVTTLIHNNIAELDNENTSKENQIYNYHSNTKRQKGLFQDESSTMTCSTTGTSQNSISHHIDEIGRKCIVDEPLHCRNLFNFQGYVIATSFSFFVYDPTSEMRNIEFRTLFTPIEWMFNLRFVIAVSQGIFVIAQLLPRYRSAAIVQDGVKFWYIPICIFQIAWVDTMTDHAHWSSWFVVVLILICLLCLIKSQYNIVPDISNCQYVLFCLPFELDCGWMIGALLINENMAVKSGDENLAVQLTVAAMSLHILLAVAVCFLFIPDRPNYLIPLILSWVSLGIWMELKDPDEIIVEAFGNDTVHNMLENAFFITIIIWSFIFLRALGAYLTRRTVIEQRMIADHYIKELR